MHRMIDGACVAIRATVVRPARVLTLALLVTFSTAACLSDDNDESNDASPTVSESAPSTETADPTSTVAGEPASTAGSDAPTTADTGPTPTTGTDAATPAVGGSPMTVLQGPGVTVDELTADGDAFVGQRVVVHGEVLEALAEGMFTIQDDAEILLVTGADPALMPQLVPGTFVRVAGDVETFDPAAFESALGTTIDDAAFGRFEGQPAIVAESVQVGPLTVSLVTDDVASFEDQVIAVAGEVSDVVGPQAFVVRDPADADGSEPLLIVTPYRAVPGESAVSALVEARGSIQTLDTSNPTSLGDGFAFLSDPAYDAFDGQSVVVAEQVQVVAPGATSSVGDVIAGGDELVGQSAVLRETVTEIIGDRAFIVGAGENRLLIIVAAGEVPPGLAQGALIVVDGIVTRLDPATPPVVDPAGSVDWNDDEIEAFAGELILVTRSVVVIASE